MQVSKLCTLNIALLVVRLVPVCKKHVSFTLMNIILRYTKCGIFLQKKRLNEKGKRIETIALKKSAVVFSLYKPHVGKANN